MGVYRYFKGVGAGYTREIESIKEKDEHCERAHGYQEREEVFFSGNVSGSGNTDTDCDSDRKTEVNLSKCQDGPTGTHG